MEGVINTIDMVFRLGSITYIKARKKNFPDRRSLQFI